MHVYMCPYMFRYCIYIYIQLLVCRHVSVYIYMSKGTHNCIRARVQGCQDPEIPFLEAGCLLRFRDAYVCTCTYTNI